MAKVMNGVCKYCGQIISVSADTQDVADKLATEMCNCELAKIAARTTRNIGEAKRLTEELFPASEDERNVGLVQALHAIIDEIGLGTFKTASLQINGKISVAIGKTAKGSIKVARTDKVKQAYETVE